MDIDETGDGELIARLKRLDASGSGPRPSFNCDVMFERHTAGVARSRRRLAVARGTASALVIALLAASVWRLDQQQISPPVVREVAPEVNPQPAQQRIVRADTYLAVAALEDHIASVDDALNVARVRGGAAEVARLERTRTELFESYSHLRYAELVSANF